MSAKPNGKLVNDPRIDEWISMYLALRREAEKHEEIVKTCKAKQEELRAEMLVFLDRSGLEGVRTKVGTAYLTVKDHASLSDPDVFMTFVIENKAFELMNRSANATACREYAVANKELPPGVKLNTKRSINVLRAGEKP